MDITIYSIPMWITGVLIGSVAIAVYLGSNKRSSRAFAFSILLVTIWIVVSGFLESVSSYEIANILVRTTYFLGGAIPCSFLYFFYTFPEDKLPPKMLPISLCILQIIFFFLFFFSNLIIVKPFTLHTDPPWGWQFGALSFLFDLFFFGFFISGIVILYSKYRKCKDSSWQKHLKYILGVIIVGSIPPSLVSVILPRLGYFDLNWLGSVTQIFWIPILAYSIAKHRIFNTKIIAIEIVTFALWIVILIRTFLAQNLHEVLIESALLFVTVIFGILLIRSVLHEISQRERIEQLAQDLKNAYTSVHELNDHLEQKVAEQTEEIRAAYEVEKKARVELEKLNETKDQFIMITQHHLRTPVTSLRWQMEELLRGAYGKLTKKLAEAIGDAETSAQRLTHIINNFLSITALKAGTEILNTSQASLKPLIEDILNELKKEISSQALTVTYPIEEHAWPSLRIDADKMREVLLIIIENAVRYNKNNGHVSIQTKQADHRFEVTVENTGITIAPEDIQNIWKETFYRGNEARTAHPMGMGIGLSVARAVVKSHKGEIKVEPMAGYGTRVRITLPA